jgi:hypothetical protein
MGQNEWNHVPRGHVDTGIEVCTQYCPGSLQALISVQQSAEDQSQDTPRSGLPSLCCSSKVSNKSPLGGPKDIAGEALRKLMVGESYDRPILAHIPIPVKPDYQRIRLPAAATPIRRRVQLQSSDIPRQIFGLCGKPRSTSLFLPTVTFRLARCTPAQCSLSSVSRSLSFCSV